MYIYIMYVITVLLLFSTRWPPSIHKKDNHVLAIMVSATHITLCSLCVVFQVLLCSLTCSTVRKILQCIIMYGNSLVTSSNI